MKDPVDSAEETGQQARFGHAVADERPEDQLAILRIQKEIALLDTDLPQVLTVIVERACALTCADSGAIHMLEGDALVCHASAGTNRLKPGIRLGLDSSLAGLSVQTAGTMVCNDTQADPRIDKDAQRCTGSRSLVAVPLLVDNAVIAVLVLASKRVRAFTERDVASLQILVETLGATIKRHRMAAQLQASERQYRLLFAHNPQPMWVYEPATFQILAVNQSMVAHYGYTEEELLAMTMRDIWSEKIPRSEEILRQVQSAQPSFNVRRRHLKKDGTHIDVDISSSPILFNGIDARLVSATDVTQRLRAERELARLSRAQQMLSACNHAQIHATSQDALLQEITRITVVIGGYLGAWVGLARDDQAKSIDRLAFAGVAPSGLHQRPASWSPDTLAGQGPSGRTIRTGQPVIVEDIAPDEVLHPWKDLLLADGVRGLISLPLRDAQRTFGLLFLYSGEVVKVSADEIKLLQELADNLAFGIGNLQAQQESLRDVETRIEILRIQQEIAVLDADLPHVMTLMAERALALTRADGGVVDLVDGADLVCHAHAGASFPPLGSRLAQDGSLAGLAARTATVMITGDAPADPRVNQEAIRARGVRSLLIVPLAVDNEVAGVLRVTSARLNAFGQRDVANLQILAESLGAAIKRHRMGAQLQASEQQYRSLFAENPQPMWVYETASLRLLAVNQAMVAHYGYTEQELLAMTLRDLWFEADQDYAQSLHQRPHAEWAYSVVRQHRKKDGTPIDLEISASPTVFGGAPARMVLAVDVTQRLRAERDLARVSRAQRMLSTCNEALIRATSQDALLREICRITVDIGGYLGAWVGFARDDEDHSIERMAFAGVMPSQESFDEKASWSTTLPRGRGPAGRTIRSGQAVIVENIEREDVALLPRKDKLRAAGIHSMISLPLHDSERTFGLLFLFASEVIEVSPDEIKLLQELANDLAFGILNLRSQATVRDQAALLDKAQDAIIVRGMDDTVLFWNHGAERLYGWTAQEVLGGVIWESVYQDPSVFREATRNVMQSGVWTAEVMHRRKDGTLLAVEARWTLVRDDQGRPQSILAINTDITQRKTAEREIQRLAFYDTLTQLPNRLLLMDRLQHALAGCARTGRCGALLFIDLDNFKTLNDTLGHEKGDLLLQQVATRLAECVREADTVARFGGDEFVVMLEDLSDRDADAASMARAIGEKVLAALSMPYLLDGYEHSTTSSIGVAPFGQHHQGASELLKQADLAMYQAKTAGRNAMRFFDPTMQAIVNARVLLEFEMRLALTQQEYALHYQPQFDAEGQVIGVEALLRWRHPQRGPVSPAEFIPLAEETGIIIPLGHWVLRTACDQLNAWQASRHTAHLTMAVNVSARQFHSADFVQQVTQVLKITGVDASRLKLELTESMLVADLELTIAKMAQLKALGLHFSLDDFGTGYSSLSYLKRLPLDQLKIDQSFVRDIITDVNDASIVRTIIALGQSLGLGVIAEGVETQAQRDFLASHGCLAYQGYLFSRPLPVDELQVFLQHRSGEVKRQRNELKASGGAGD